MPALALTSANPELITTLPCPLCGRKVFEGENVKFGNPVSQAWSKINSEWNNGYF